MYSPIINCRFIIYRHMYVYMYTYKNIKNAFARFKDFEVFETRN